MTDRELLELAAKAAGIRYHSYIDSELFGRGINIGEVDVPLWSPLDDDGDALRLAVKLGMHVVIDNENGLVRVYCQSSTKPEEAYGGGQQGADPCAATRRAIVRAAAEIGRYA